MKAARQCPSLAPWSSRRSDSLAYLKHRSTGRKSENMATSSPGVRQQCWGQSFRVLTAVLNWAGIRAGKGENKTSKREQILKKKYSTPHEKMSCMSTALPAKPFWHLGGHACNKVVLSAPAYGL